MSTRRMTVAQAVVRFLAQQYSERDGVEHRFIHGMWGIFGHGNVAGLGQALEEVPEAEGLRYYRPQNEQAMVHLAAAFSKHNNRLATYACTASIGPGSTNMLTAAAGATINRVPVLLFPSDYFANRSPDPVLQQLEHSRERDLSVNDCFRPISVYFDRISRPEQLLSSLPEAMRVLTDPSETGTATISLPEDVQTEAYDFPAIFFERRTWHVRRVPPEPELLEHAVRLIRAAKRPLIVAGGGVIYSEATEALRAFAENFGIPVCETQAGKGSLPWNHPMCAGPVGAIGGLAANRLAKDADLVIAIGTRLGDFATASKSAFRNPELRVIGINIAPLDAHKLRGVPLVADARRALEALNHSLEESGLAASGAYKSEIASLKREWDSAVDQLRAITDQSNLSQSQVIALVNEAAGGIGTVVCAAGSMPGDLNKLWRPEHPKAYHLEYGFSCMGYEIPAGLGIKLAEPERRVFVMIGDGTYLLMNSEIVTAVQEGITLTIVLVDNHGYQSIHGLQRSVGSPSFGNELRFRDHATGRLTGDYVPVDFAKHAEAMGAHATFTDTVDTLRRALLDAGQHQGVSVIVANVDPEQRVPGFESWWDVPVAAATEQDSVKQARKAYDTAREHVRIFA